MDDLKIEIDIKEAMAALQGLSPSAMQAAWRRTLRKTAGWIKSQTAKEVGAATKIRHNGVARRDGQYTRGSITT